MCAGINKPCLKCKKASIAGTKKRTMAKRRVVRRSKSDLTGQLTNVALAAAGYILADQVNKIPFVAQNPNIGNWVKLGAGLYLAMSQPNSMIVSAAQGMALNGAIGAGKQWGVVSGVAGLLDVGQGSNWTPGVAGPSIIVK